MDTNTSTISTARLRRIIILAAALTFLIAGAIGYGVLGQWASRQGGPELAPGGYSNCHIGYTAPQFTGPIV